MTEVAIFETNKLASLSDPKVVEAAKANAAQAVSGLQTSAGDTPLLKMSQEGKWTVGIDDQEVPADFRWGIDPFSVSIGWVCWKGNRPIDRRMVPVLEGQPCAESELPDLGPYKGGMEGWKSAVEFTAAGIDSPVKVKFNSTSGGAAKAVNKLIGAMMVQISKQDGNPVPVITVDSDSYFNKNYSKDIWFPIFDIVGFADAKLQVSPIVDILPPQSDGGADDLV